MPPAAAPAVLSYEVPVVSAFSGAGAVGALPAGGQLVQLSGSNFGPAGRGFVGNVTYFPSGAAGCVS